MLLRGVTHVDHCIKAARARRQTIFSLFVAVTVFSYSIARVSFERFY
jgi:hypothetical protein